MCRVFSSAFRCFSASYRIGIVHNQYMRLPLVHIERTRLYHSHIKW